MENVNVYKIKYFLKCDKKPYNLPPMDGLQASLKYRELLDTFNTITIFLIKNKRVIDSTIKIEGVYVD